MLKSSPCEFECEICNKVDTFLMPALCLQCRLKEIDKLVLGKDYQNIKRSKWPRWFKEAVLTLCLVVIPSLILGIKVNLFTEITFLVGWVVGSVYERLEDIIIK